MEDGKAPACAPRSEGKVTDALTIAGAAGVAFIACLLGLCIARDEQRLRRARQAKDISASTDLHA